MTAVMKIFYGPPGTGKTFRTAREAVRIIDGTVDESTVMQRYRELIERGQIWPVTFHPSYSYEDFVEGFRPKLVQGQVIYEVVDGPFKLACARCRGATGLQAIKVGDRLGTGGRYEVIAVTPFGIAVRSENTRSDAVTPIVEQHADLWTIQRLRERDIRPEDLSSPGKKNDERQDVAKATNLPTTILTGSGHLRAFYEALEQGLATGPEPVVLVIDEINRADLSRVFGELLTLIEVDKRVGAAEERRVLLPYSKSWLSVPQELSIIGTMNTADRSLAVMDLALRRRFSFEEVPPRPDLCPSSWGGLDVRRLLERWNDRISTLRSREHRMGHAELMSERLLQVARDHKWGEDAAGQLKSLAWTVRHKVLPLLLEYFHEDWRKVHKTLGAPGLLTERRPADGQAYYGDIADVADVSSFDVSDWWDPEQDTKWDATRFSQAMSAVPGTEG